MSGQLSDHLQNVNRRWTRGGVTRIRIDAPLTVPAHGHAHQHLCVVVNGAFDERWRPVAHCDGGTMRLSPAADVHELRIVEAPFECVVIGMTDKVQAGAPSARVYGSSIELLAQAKRLSAEMEKEDPLSRLEVHGLSAELLAASLRVAANREVSAVPAWLLEVRNALDREFTKPAPLSRLASSVGIHPVHVSRAFRTHFGRTVREYVRERRLAAAVQWLRTQDASISSIAAECGFSDHAHLARAMRTSIGATPSSLRVQGAGGNASAS